MSVDLLRLAVSAATGAAVIVSSGYTAGGTSGTTHTLPGFSVGAGNSLVVVFCGRDLATSDRAVVSATWNGVALTTAGGADNTFRHNADVFHLHGASAATGDVVVTTNGAVGFAAIFAFEVSGLAASAPVDSASSVSDVGAPIAAMPVSVSAGWLVVTGASCENVDANESVSADFAPSYSTVASTRQRSAAAAIAGSSGTVDPVWSRIDSTHAAFTIAYRT